MPGKHLDVYYHGKQVGTLAETPEKIIAFQYTHDWLKEGFSISPFSLPLRDNVFVPKDKNRDFFDGLYGVFSDSLPDNWGRLLLDKYLLSHGINAADLSALDKLAYIGASGMGALEYHPSKEKDFNIDTKGLNYDEIAGECDKILSSKPSDRLDLLYNLGGSSGGTRPKILLSEAGKEWIIKFPASKDPKICGIRTYFGEHTTSVNGKGKDIAKDDLIKVGMDAGLKKDYCLECLEEIQTGVGDLEKYSVKPKRGRGEKIPVSVRLSDMIENLPGKR